MRDLMALTNVPFPWILVAVALVLIVGSIWVDKRIAKKYDRWIDDIDERYAFQPSHLEESEAAAITRMHLEHQERNTHQTVVQ